MTSRSILPALGFALLSGAAMLAPARAPVQRQCRLATAETRPLAVTSCRIIEETSFLLFFGTVRNQGEVMLTVPRAYAHLGGSGDHVTLHVEADVRPSVLVPGQTGQFILVVPASSGSTVATIAFAPGTNPRRAVIGDP